MPPEIAMKLITSGRVKPCHTARLYVGQHTADDWAGRRCERRPDGERRRDADDAGR